LRLALVQSSSRVTRGYFAVIMGVCAIMLGYTLWDRERNGQIVGKGW